MTVILEVVILSKITDKLNEKLGTPFPHFDDGKMTCFGCGLNLSLSRVDGWFYFSNYSVQD